MMAKTQRHLPRGSSNIADTISARDMHRLAGMGRASIMPYGSDPEHLAVVGDNVYVLVRIAPFGYRGKLPFYQWIGRTSEDVPN